MAICALPTSQVDERVNQLMVIRMALLQTWYRKRVNWVQYIIEYWNVFISPVPSRRRARSRHSLFFSHKERCRPVRSLET